MDVSKLNIDSVDLPSLAEKMGISMKSQKELASFSVKRIVDLYGRNAHTIRSNFDGIVAEIEKIAYAEYLKEEMIYGKQVFKAYSELLLRKYGVDSIEDFVTIMGRDFKSFDRFFLSLSQSRKARAGKTFELIHNTLFSELNYPFTEQPNITGKPDFVIPSYAHYRENPLDCILFTAMRTLRERWRLIPPTSNKGLGFFLATIDTKVSNNQLKEMMERGIRLVVPLAVKNIHYNRAVNVFSFKQFFDDHLDLAITRWTRDGII